MIKIGNASGFWGDDPNAPKKLLEQQPDLDFLTLDYLSEVSLSIMAIQREKDPKSGFARDFLKVVEDIIPFWQKGFKVKLVTNAGGLNPLECAAITKQLLLKANLPTMKVAAITGDDVLEQLRDEPNNPLFANLDTHASLLSILPKMATANAYIGAEPIIDALNKGAAIVIGGRIADPSLTVGPCSYHFKWSEKDYNQIAGATIAGHLIECGTQATGGIFTDWLNIPHPENIGFPVVEMESDGTFVITKPKKTGGLVSEMTVKEQLLYEIGNPESYLSPDAEVSFLSLKVEDLNNDRVRVSGAKGLKPPETYKVNATYHAGYKAEGTLTLFGKNVIKKAQITGNIILQKLQQEGFVVERSLIECLGAGDLVPRIADQAETKECVLRVAVADSRYEVVELFAKEIAPLVTSGPSGTTGYISGRPKIRPIYGFWPCLIAKSHLSLQNHYY